MAGNGWSNNIVSTLIFEEGTGFTGLFFYSPTVGLGNLVGSWTANAGVDPYGNSYPDGLSVVGGTIFTPNLVAASITAGSIGSSTISNSSFMGGTVSDSTITFDSSGGALLLYETVTTSVTFDSGSGNWTAPAGVTSVKAECWGSGFSGSAGGGSGGEYAQEPALAVTPGNSYAYSVAPGLVVLNETGATTFAGDSGTVTAHSGTLTSLQTVSGGTGGTGSANTIHFNGGDGGARASNAGGGGGSSAGISNAGTAGGPSSGNTGGTGGVAPAGGGSGGRGADEPGSGVNGSAPGGGGGGFAVNTDISGTGAAGQVKLTWTTSNALIGSISAAPGTDQYGNAYPADFMGLLQAIEPGSSPTVVEIWHAASLATGFTTSVADQAPRYRLEGIGGGVVRLDGTVYTSGSVSANAPMFTLPAGYRPTQRKRFTGVNSASGYTLGGTLVEVDTTGVVMIGTSAGTTEQIVLDGITFPAD